MDPQMIEISIFSEEFRVVEYQITTDYIVINVINRYQLSVISCSPRLLITKSTVPT